MEILGRNSESAFRRLRHRRCPVSCPARPARSRHRPDWRDNAITERAKGGMRCAFPPYSAAAHRRSRRLVLGCERDTDNRETNYSMRPAASHASSGHLRRLRRQSVPVGPGQDHPSWIGCERY
jgi:hypothetical protein